MPIRVARGHPRSPKAAGSSQPRPAGSRSPKSGTRGTSGGADNFEGAARRARSRGVGLGDVLNAAKLAGSLAALAVVTTPLAMVFGVSTMLDRWNTRGGSAGNRSGSYGGYGSSGS